MVVESNEPVHIRDISPKDFLFARILQDKGESALKLISRLVINPESLEPMPARDFRTFTVWVSNNILKESILTPESWMEIAFHLNKQRWDGGIDWLEVQPMTRIKRMIEINQKVAEEQQDAIKNSKGKRR